MAMTLELCALVTPGNSPGPGLEEVSVSSAAKERTRCVRGVQQKCQRARFRRACQRARRGDKLLLFTLGACLASCFWHLFVVRVRPGSGARQGCAPSAGVTLAPHYCCGGTKHPRQGANVCRAKPHEYLPCGVGLWSPLAACGYRVV